MTTFKPQWSVFSTRRRALGRPMLLVSAAGVFLVCFGLALAPAGEFRAPKAKVPGTPGESPLNPNDRLKDEPTPPMTKEQVLKKADELRKKYPFESLARRLAYEDRFAAEAKDRPAPVLKEDATKHLEALEVAGQIRPYGNSMRTLALSMLHSKEVERFITREGFGLMRLPQPSVRHLELVDAEPVRYPLYLLETTQSQTTDLARWSAPGEQNPWKLPARDLLFGFHLAGQLDFAGPASMGLAKDRDHVAGFKPHQFRQLPQLVTRWDGELKRPGEPPPQPVEEWVLRRLELVSLLKHEKPAVYVSATLPKMDDLHNAQTRELSGFESESLKSLKSGESLVARAKANHLEMVGALRAGKQCLECHQVQRGELLGAFSYELHRNPELKPDKSEASGGG